MVRRMDADDALDLQATVPQQVQKRMPGEEKRMGKFPCPRQRAFQKSAHGREQSRVSVDADEDQAPGPQDAHEFGDKVGRGENVVDDIEGKDGVETGVREGELFAYGRDEVAVNCIRAQRAVEGHQRVGKHPKPVPQPRAHTGGATAHLQNAPADLTLPVKFLEQAGVALGHSILLRRYGIRLNPEVRFVFLRLPPASA